MRTEYWMRAKDASHLDPKQLQNRLKILDLLHRYWKDEKFPINTTHKQKVPQIKDQKGTLCAVAYVMYNSGQQNLVSSLAQDNNYVLIDDVPDNHDLADSLKHNGISKKEAARIQPGYSCHATIGPIHAGEPIVEFFGVILSIAGLAIALSFCGGLNHARRNIDKRTVVIVIILGVVVGSGGFGMIYQNSVAEPFGDSDFPGTRGSVRIVGDVSLYYWIEGGSVEEIDRYGNVIMINPDSDGQITVAYPPVLVEAYNGVNYNQFGGISEDVFVDSEHIDHLKEYYLNGYTILTIPFDEDNSSIEIFSFGMCGAYTFDGKSNP